MNTKQENKKQVSIKVHLPTGLRDEFVHLTKRMGQTQSAVIRQMIEVYIQNQQTTDINFSIEQQSK